MTAERNDPTQSGFTPPPDGVGLLSCNEVEALCLKAARGAGFDWGLAEEAGFAARWLHERGIDGSAALLAHLDRLTRSSSPVVVVDGAFRAGNGGVLCPIAVGAALSDFAAINRDPVRAGPVDRPVLLLPFLHQIAHADQNPVALTSSAGSVTVSAAGEIAGALAALLAEDAAEITVAPATAAPDAASAPDGVAAPTPDTLTRLTAYAALTYVPASAASRADAGSAEGDND